MDNDEFFKKPEDDDIEMDEFEEDEELDNIIILNDEDGNDMQFEFLDLVESEGKEYIVLLPVDEADAGEVRDSLLSLYARRFYKWTAFSIESKIEAGA